MGGEFKDLPSASRSSAHHGAGKKKRKIIVNAFDTPPFGANNTRVSVAPTNQVASTTMPPTPFFTRLLDVKMIAEVDTFASSPIADLTTIINQIIAE